ncbi:MAG: hypothetical protein KAS32_01810 [Candidatus Peribacteraceae bacterium]|nr:hypothetical protein [Candidatus Peribacteraceae bacterium]
MDIPELIKVLKAEILVIETDFASTKEKFRNHKLVEELKKVVGSLEEYHLNKKHTKRLLELSDDLEHEEGGTINPDSLKHFLIVADMYPTKEFAISLTPDNCVFVSTKYSTGKISLHFTPENKIGWVKMDERSDISHENGVVDTTEESPIEILEKLMNIK